MNRSKYIFFLVFFLALSLLFLPEPFKIPIGIAAMVLSSIAFVRSDILSRPPVDGKGYTKSEKLVRSWVVLQLPSACFIVFSLIIFALLFGALYLYDHFYPLERKEFNIIGFVSFIFSLVSGFLFARKITKQKS